MRRTTRAQVRRHLGQRRSGTRLVTTDILARRRRPSGGGDLEDVAALDDARDLAAADALLQAVGVARAGVPLYGMSWLWVGWNRNMYSSAAVPTTSTIVRSPLRRNRLFKGEVPPGWGTRHAMTAGPRY